MANADKDFLPYFRLFPRDLLLSPSVRRMATDEFGAYMLLLCDSWTEDGLPDDIDELLNRTGLERERFAEVWPKLSACFVLEDGVWRNARLEEERAKARKTIAQRKAAGQASAASRRGGNER